MWSSTSVQFSHSVVSDPLGPHRLQHARPPCPLPTPGVYSNSSPLSQWCHPTISSSVVPFSSCLQSFPAAAAAAKSPQSYLTLCDPVDCSLPGSCPWDSPGKNTGGGCHFLLQGIFLNQGWNLRLLRFLQWLAGSLPASHQGSPNNALSTTLYASQDLFTFFG